MDPEIGGGQQCEIYEAIKGGYLLNPFLQDQMGGHSLFPLDLKLIQTRKHSSSMRTAHLPNVSRGSMSGRGWVPTLLKVLCQGEWVPTPLDIPTSTTLDIPTHPRRDLVPETISTHPRRDLIPETMPSSMWTDRHLWNHYLPATSFAGDNKSVNQWNEIPSDASWPHYFILNNS